MTTELSHLNIGHKLPLVKNLLANPWAENRSDLNSRPTTVSLQGRDSGCRDFDFCQMRILALRYAP